MPDVPCITNSSKVSVCSPIRTRPGRKVTAWSETPYTSWAKAIKRRLIVLAAFRAAMPLRSEPADAAVGLVFGTLPVWVEVIWDAVDIDLQFFSDDLGYFHQKALTHLGAPMVEVNTAILIDMDQGAGLVECGGGE